MDNLLEMFDNKKVIMKTYIERLNTITANDTMRNVIKEKGTLQEDGSYVYNVYKGEIGEQFLVLLPSGIISIHSHNEQMMDRNLVITDTSLNLNDNEPLGIVADGYLVHLPAAIESTEQLESVLVELDPTVQNSDER